MAKAVKSDYLCFLKGTKQQFSALFFTPIIVRFSYVVTFFKISR